MMGAPEMFGFDALAGSAHAAATVGIVLAEALTLYVGYGALARVAGPSARQLLRGD
ncbi:DUF7512 family protein [Haloferacaceae archaeon DSL9]